MRVLKILKEIFESSLFPHPDFSVRYRSQDLSGVLLTVVRSPLGVPSVIRSGMKGLPLDACTIHCRE